MTSKKKMPINLEICRTSDHEELRPSKLRDTRQDGRACAEMLWRNSKKDNDPLLHFLCFCLRTVSSRWNRRCCTEHKTRCLRIFDKNAAETHCRSPVPRNKMKRGTRLMQFSTTTSFLRSTRIVENIRSKPFAAEQLPYINCIKSLMTSFELFFF